MGLCPGYLCPGGLSVQGGLRLGGLCLGGGGLCQGDPPRTVQRGCPGTHPTRMHSCFSLCFHTCALQETFETLKSWISELRKHGPVNIVLAVAGNKCDLEDLRQVQYKGKGMFTRNEILWPKFGPKLFVNFGPFIEMNG